jgi:hypothetical protein
MGQRRTALRGDESHILYHDSVVDDVLSESGAVEARPNGRLSHTRQVSAIFLTGFHERLIALCKHKQLTGVLQAAG